MRSEALTSQPVTYERSDYVALYRLINRRARKRVMIAFGAAIAVNVALLIPHSTLPIAATVLPYLLLWAIVVGLFSWPVLGGTVAYRTARKNGQLKPYVFRIEQDVLEATSDGIDLTVKWSHSPCYKLFKDRIFVFTARRCALIVPRRAFGNETQFKAFADVAAERWEATR